MGEKRDFFMPSVVPYSEKQQILKPEEWERTGILDQDCPTAIAAAKTMRAIVLRLLKIDKSIDINDFEFLVYDDPKPNAGFISAKKTQNHKNVVLISTGITGLCKTEDELAGILAHEIGHFTYFKIWADNENTVFQERFSDLHALDLMLAGGYDPVAYSRVCETMRLSYDGDSMFDVHGSSMARKEDVDAYLTKLHEDLGDFKVSAPTGLYGNFAKIMNSGRDVYKSYFTQLLEKNFPRTAGDFVYYPPIKQVLKLILSEFKSGRLNNSSRIKDMLDYLRDYEPRRKPELQSTQDFLEQLVALYGQDPNMEKQLSFWDLHSLCEVLIDKFRGHKPFKIFYPVTEYLNKVKKFMTSRDPAYIKEFVDDFHNHDDKKMFRIYELKSIFGEPAGFKMPPRATAKGHVMPTHWLWSEYYGTPFWSDLQPVLEAIGFDCDYKFLTDDGLDRGTKSYQYGGKIIATNEKEINQKLGEQIEQRTFKRQNDNFRNFIFVIDTLYDFVRGKISASDVVKKMAQSGYEVDSIINLLQLGLSLTDRNHKNKFLESELEVLNNSVAFAEIFIKPFLKNVKLALQSLNSKLADQIHLDTPPHGKTWFEYLVEVSSKYLKLKEYMPFRAIPNNTNTLNRAAHVVLDGVVTEVTDAKRRLGIQDNDVSVWNVEAGPIVWHVSDQYTMVLRSLLTKFIDAAVQEGAISSQDATKMLEREYVRLVMKNSSGWSGATLTKILKAVSQKEAAVRPKATADIVEQFSVYASRQDWAIYDWPHFFNELDLEFKKNTDLHKIHRLLAAYGMLANTEQELADVMSKPVPLVSLRDIHTAERRIKECCLRYYMRKKAPIKNLYPILFAVRKDRISNFGAEFADELGDYIEKNHLIPSDFHQKYDLYALIENLNLFSRAKPAQAQMLDSLIADVQKMPRQAREEYSWKLLSGFYYPDSNPLYDFNRESERMDMPLAKDKLIEVYTGAIAERLGRDNNSDEYFAKIQELSEFINEKHLYDSDWNGFNRKGLDKLTQGKLYRVITDKIRSQERVSQFLANDRTVVLSDSDAQEKDMLGRSFEELLDILCRNPKLAINTIEFLNERLTSESVSRYCQKCMKDDDSGRLVKMLVASTVENCYHTFWSSGIKVRALIMGKLLNRAFNTLDERIMYVCDMNFDKNDKYRTDAEVICDCVIKSFEPYEQTLILAAIASADENKQAGKKSSRSVGEGLRMFFETMGPAWVKFGQLLSYVPDLPSEIRRDLGKLKDRADIPARWDVYTWLRKALPEDLFGRIERVEDVVGAGSFWMTAVVLFKGEDGKTEKKVIQLLRQHADERSDAGFRTIETAIKKLAKRNPSYKVLQSVARQAHESAKYEVDDEIGCKQYLKAKELYGDIKVEIDGTQYSPKVADWRYHGTGKDGIAYKVMDYANGATLSRAKVSDDERRKMALAYFTIEMVVLFKGDVWDIDRHQGQQNFDIVSPSDVDINIYDTGAQLPKAPDKTNKVLLASIFFGLMQAVQKGMSIDAYLLKTIKKLDKLEKGLNVDVSYVSNVEKGLMALSDIIEYQKEIKDKDGNIIQERKVLSADDLKYAIMAVLQNPSVDKYLNVVIRGRAVADKLVRLQLKELKELAHSSEFGPDNPVKISIISDGESSSDVRKLNKAQEEIKALDKPDEYILGIPKKHIRFNPDLIKPLKLDPPAKEFA